MVSGFRALGPRVAGFRVLETGPRVTEGARGVVLLLGALN